MDKLTGAELAVASVGGYRHIADLIAFDGPFLSLLTDDAQQEALLLWLDCDTRANRWLLLDVARADLRGYLLRELSLLEILRMSKELIVYDQSRSKRKNVLRMSVDELPAAYLPLPDSYLTPNIATPDAKALANTETIRYSIRLDGEVFVNDLGNFTKFYQQLYSFHYGLEHLDRASVRDIITTNVSAWTGGGNSVHMFSGLNAVMPSVHRARVTKMEFASPGHIQIELLPLMAKEIHASVSNLSPKVTFEQSERLYSEIYKYFRKHGLGFEDRAIRRTTSVPAEVMSELTQYVQRLLQLFAWQHYKAQFLALDMDALAQLRALLAYYRRLRSLVRYQQRGMIDLEPIAADPSSALTSS